MTYHKEEYTLHNGQKIYVQYNEYNICQITKECIEMLIDLYQQGRADAIDDFAKYIREKVLFEEKWLIDCKSNNANTNIAFSSIMTFINSVAEELKKHC